MRSKSEHQDGGVDLYYNRAFIPDFDALIAETAARSRELVARSDMMQNVAYGPSPRAKLDLVFSGKPRSDAPLHIFLHGGYWRSGSKDDHTLVAAPVLQAGGVAALVGYDLMPGTRLAEIVAQVRSACHFLGRLAPTIGVDVSRITASGHSAGAHLASLLAATAPGDRGVPDLPALKGLLLVSGIYDLSGIPGSFLKDEAMMRPDEAADWSPLSACHSAGIPRIITRGEAETQPFHDQAVALERTLIANDETAELRTEPGQNHLSIVLALADPLHPLGQRLADMVAS